MAAVNRPPIQVSAMVPECVPNIGRRGRRRRLRWGIGVSVATILLVALLATSDATPLTYLAISPFTVLAAVYFLQVKEKT